ncbi:site-specific integrase [Antribacter sp. KLBMP9083]|uniref:Site-specific integrase n=1 Tax=Antribacter soli TaxID=2910976 RepID=A0AA41QH75_9MICO|nr:site-specific integrase [Antribacter soli]MCF4123041.1 site-specific integrase [Antribacter soli]
MSGRDPETLTKHGSRYVTSDGTSVKPDVWTALVYVRDADGVRRRVKRFGVTKDEARAELEAAIGDRHAPSTAEIKPTTTVARLGKLWWDNIERASQHSEDTLRLYELNLDKYVTTGALAHLQVREVNAGRVADFLHSLIDKSTGKGRGTAKTVRTVLRGMFTLAVSNGAIDRNPVREAEPITAPRKVVQRIETAKRDQFTDTEKKQILHVADTVAKHNRRDVGDLIAFMQGTGVRIGEALALRWDDLDLVEGTAETGLHTVTRPRGGSLEIVEHGSTKIGDRILKLPPWLVVRLLDRMTRVPANELNLVFPTATYPTAKNGAATRRGGTLRDVANTTKQIRQVFEDAGVEVPKGQGSHLFRKSVASKLNRAGLSDREVANQLGHASTKTTRDIYMSRKTVGEAAAELL